MVQLDRPSKPFHGPVTTAPTWCPSFSAFLVEWERSRGEVGSGVARLLDPTPPAPAGPQARRGGGAPAVHPRAATPVRQRPSGGSEEEGGRGVWRSEEKGGTAIIGGARRRGAPRSHARTSDAEGDREYGRAGGRCGC
jgi:hypothetical protein